MKFGGIGCALGTAISMIVGNGFIMNWYYQAHIGLDMVYFWKRILGIVPALVLCVGGYYLYEAIITGNFAAPALDIPGYLTQVALSSVVYLALGAALDRAGLKKKLGEI